MTNYWLWVVGRHAVEDISNITESGDLTNWYGCHKDTKKGDKALIYLTKPHMEIRYLVNIIEDCKPKSIPTDKGNANGYDCECRLDTILKNPLTIQDMRKSLPDWYPVKINFNKMKFPIYEDDWLELRKLIVRKK